MRAPPEPEAVVGSARTNYNVLGGPRTVYGPPLPGGRYIFFYAVSICFSRVFYVVVLLAFFIQKY